MRKIKAKDFLKKREKDGKSLEGFKVDVLLDAANNDKELKKSPVFRTEVEMYFEESIKPENSQIWRQLAEPLKNSDEILIRFYDQDVILMKDKDGKMSFNLVEEIQERISDQNL